jgi:2-oxoglutarate dehydrogenase E2 component (dihydrolipoamide succinyltransferase)
MAVELKIPTAGESITEVQIGEWHKSEGDWVERDEPVVEIETDKASMELPAPQAGVLAKILIQSGENANVGDVIAHIDETAAIPAGAKVDGAASAGDATKSAGRIGAAAGGTSAQCASATATAARPPSASNQDVRVMPAARRVMADHGLSATDITATGPGGRILKEDAQRAADSRSHAPTGDAQTGGAPRDGEAPAEPPGSGSRPRAADVAAGAPARRASLNGPDSNGGAPPEEIVPMSMLRRRIAERLVQSQNNAAILTTFNEIDMSAVLALRAERQDAFVKKYGIKLGFMAFFVKAVIDALKLIPAVNGEVRGTDIVYKNYFDIGVAVSTDRGLVVPVVRSAERLSFAEVELAIADLATRARDRKLGIEELQGGTFTISNGGIFGSLLSTPIINPPQSGILGLHAIQQRPVAIDGKVEIRPMMYVALSYDHRLIDGRESVTFLKRVKECVEEPARMLIEV